MKLYATVTGVRTVDGRKVEVSKSQGSNERIDIEVLDEHKKRVFGACLSVRDGYVDVYATTYEGVHSQEIDNCVIRDKGEKQKGEMFECQACHEDMPIRRNPDGSIYHESCPHCDN